MIGSRVYFMAIETVVQTKRKHFIMFYGSLVQAAALGMRLGGTDQTNANAESNLSNKINRGLHTDSYSRTISTFFQFSWFA